MPLSLRSWALTLMQPELPEENMQWPLPSGTMLKKLVYVLIIFITAARLAGTADVPEPAANMRSLLQSYGHGRHLTRRLP